MLKERSKPPIVTSTNTLTSLVQANPKTARFENKVKPCLEVSCLLLPSLNNYQTWMKPQILTNISSKNTNYSSKFNTVRLCSNLRYILSRWMRLNSRANSNASAMVMYSICPPKDQITSYIPWSVQPILISIRWWGW